MMDFPSDTPKAHPRASVAVYGHILEDILVEIIELIPFFQKFQNVRPEEFVSLVMTPLGMGLEHEEPTEVIDDEIGNSRSALQIDVVLFRVGNKNLMVIDENLEDLSIPFRLDDAREIARWVVLNQSSPRHDTEKLSPSAYPDDWSSHTQG